MNMKTKITRKVNIIDDAMVFEFTNQIETPMDYQDDPELFFIQQYMDLIFGEFEIPSNRVGLVAKYETMQILLASLIKNYNRFQIDRFIDTRI